MPTVASTLPLTPATARQVLPAPALTPPADRTALLRKGPFIPAVCPGAGEAGLVSVLIPAFNRAYIVGQAIESVLAQTYTNLEVIVVDDGSTDDTAELLATLVARHGARLRTVYQPNAGLAAARNAGLVLARGEFIAFQDSDDLWEPWKLQAQVALMRHVPQLVLTWTDMAAVTPTGEVLRARHLATMYHAYQALRIEQHLVQKQTLAEVWSGCPQALSHTTCRWGDLSSAMFMGNLVHPPTAVMRRSAVQQAGGLDLAYAWSCEDYEFFWRVCRFGASALIEASGMRYRIDAPDQLTQPALRLDVARGSLAAMQAQAALPNRRLKLTPRQIRDRLVSAHRWLAEEELFSERGHRGAAVASALAVLRRQPGDRRMWRVLAAALLPRGVLQRLRAARQAARQTPPRSTSQP